MTRNKSNAQKKAEDNNQVASINYQKGQVEQIQNSLNEHRDKAEKVEKQIALFETFDDGLFEKMNPEYKYETTPEYTKLLKEFTIADGKREVRELHKKIRAISEGLEKEKTRLVLLEQGIPISMIGDKDLADKQKEI